MRALRHARHILANGIGRNTNQAADPAAGQLAVIDQSLHGSL
jgi:hypothetical protein